MDTMPTSSSAPSKFKTVFNGMPTSNHDTAKLFPCFDNLQNSVHSNSAMNVIPNNTCSEIASQVICNRRLPSKNDSVCKYNCCSERTAGCRSEVGRKCYSLPNRYKGSTVNLGSHFSPTLHSSRLSSNKQPCDLCSSTLTDGSRSSLPTGVSHESFLKKLASIKSWFGSFSDIQRNRVLKDILDDCSNTQIHLLSVWLCGDGRLEIQSHQNSEEANHLHNLKNTPSWVNESPVNRNMKSLHRNHSTTTMQNENVLNKYHRRTDSESNSSSIDVNILSNSSIKPPVNLKNLPPGSCKLHLGCISNCQDPLTILPSNVSHKILSYLDPPNLARASSVSKTWLFLCSSPMLWYRLAHLPDWRLTAEGHHLQLLKHTHNNLIDWKEVMVERWRLRRNWLGAHCHVRTFSGHAEGVTCVQFDQHRIVSASHDNTIKVWSMKTNSQWPVQTLVGHSGRVRCLHLRKNRVVSGSTDSTIKVWEIEETSEWSSIVCRVTMVGHNDTVRCLEAFGDDMVLSGSYDCTIKIWRLPSGNCEKTLSGHSKPVYSLAAVEELDLIVSGSDDNTIKTWCLSTSTCLRTLHGHSDAVTSLCADVHGIISGSLDSTIRSWDIHTGDCHNTLDWMSNEGHTGVVRCVAADSRKVVSASDDKTIKVWERGSLKRLVTLRNHTDGVTCLAFNEFLIVSGSYDKTVQLWDFTVC